MRQSRSESGPPDCFDSPWQGVLRGIHYSLAKEGQGKWITRISRPVWDVVADMRPSSPAYRELIGTELNSDGGGCTICL